MSAAQSVPAAAANPVPALANPPLRSPSLAQLWQHAPSHAEQAAALAAEAHVPQVIAELLIARGITTAETAYKFLNPHIDHLHDPLLMLGMAAAVERIERAVQNGETILLYGDYDVDGTTAVVLLKTAIEMLRVSHDEPGATVRFHVPHRIREGYGIQSQVLEAAAAEGVRLVISVDTGVRAFAEAEIARRLGLDLIITDHHLPEAGESLPNAFAMLNPNQPGCTYPEKALCGAAIACKLAQALLDRRHPGRTRDKILPSFLKMVAIATVADAVPLSGENRTLAALGIQGLRSPAGLGLRALFQAANLDPTAKQLTAFDLAFRLAPRINAAGRMDVAAEVVELFTTRDGQRAHELAAKLERLNTERRATEAEALLHIENRLAQDRDEPSRSGHRMHILAGEGWHRGVIGILASRVVDRTASPAIVISIEHGVAYGSGRSIDGFPLLEAIETCADLYTRFGGHAFAVGFAMPAANLAEMERRLQDFAARKLAGVPAQHVLRIHAELPIERITPVLGGWLKRLEPLGHGNPEPVFLARNLRLATPVRLMKERHIRLDLVHERGDSRATAPVKAVGWNLAFRAQELGLREGSQIHLAYRIRENDHPEYGGLEIEIAGMKLALDEVAL